MIRMYKSEVPAVPLHEHSMCVYLVLPAKDVFGRVGLLGKVQGQVSFVGYHTIQFCQGYFDGTKSIGNIISAISAVFTISAVSPGPAPYFSLKEYHLKQAIFKNSCGQRMDQNF